MNQLQMMERLCVANATPTRKLISRPLQTLPKIPFGVEIESVVSKTRLYQTHSDILDSLNLRQSSWSCIEDKSIEQQTMLLSDSETLKCELVSPKLHFTESTIIEIEAICNALQSDVKAFVNNTCGFHVHFDAEHLSIKDVISIAINYAFFEDVIDLFMDKSRRKNRNRFIQSVHDPVKKNFNELCRILREINSGDSNYSMRSLSILDMVNPQRKLHKLNLTNAFYHNLSKIGMGMSMNKEKTNQYINTIENRHHDATIDSYDMLCWIKFNLLFIESSQKLPIFNLNKQPTTQEKIELLADFIDDDEVMYYYLNKMSL